MEREIIHIDEGKCTGCGLCIPNCPEGALQIIDGKARLISDLFCDGLGACVGHCPEDAITVEVREAEPYDERRVMENIVKQGTNTIIAHLKHLKDHGEEGFFDEAMAVLKEKERMTLEDILSHDISAIDEFIRRKFEESGKDFFGGRKDLSVLVNPPDEYELAGNDWVVVISKERPAEAGLMERLKGGSSYSIDLRRKKI